jgi:hypothetical protein
MVMPEAKQSEEMETLRETAEKEDLCAYDIQGEIESLPEYTGREDLFENILILFRNIEEEEDRMLETGKLSSPRFEKNTREAYAALKKILETL